jgi:hypothetical protein
MNFIKKLLLAALLFPVLVHAQYPTAVGSKWEYFQFREGFGVVQDVIQSWNDEVAGDTVVGANTYQIVRRTGFLYHGTQNFGAIIPTYDPLDGTFYTRVVGDEVWVLDSVVSGNAVESLLYEFGNPGVLPDILKNIVNLTPGGRVPNSHAERFDNEVLCMPSLCDSLFAFTFQQAVGAWIPACSTWYSGDHNLFLKDLGTVCSWPFWVVLDVYGEEFYLGRVTSNGQVLYRNAGFLTGLQDAPEVSMDVFPNPAADVVKLHSEIPIESLQLFDATGKSVLIQTMVGKDPAMQVGHLPRGLYWIVAQGEGMQVSRSVLLK